MSASSAPTWLEGFGDWAWPGMRPAVEIAPAAWVPALPGRSEQPAVRLRVERRRTLPRPLRLARFALLLAVAGGTFVISSGIARSGQPGVATPAAPLRLVVSVTDPFASPSALAARSASHATAALDALVPPLPAPISTDAAGSEVASISYPSPALGWRDHYLVYLPPGYSAAGTRRYPVLYLLHGDNESASSFLRLGLQPTLDRLIASHAIAPLIAVMLQADGLPNNWRNGATGTGGLAGPLYNDYVGEVQRLTDRVLRTLPDRASRAIAGYSMGGFGAMNVALAQLRSYSVVESWEGYFNNLQSELAADHGLLARLPLHAFVYAGRSDKVVGTAEVGPWTAALRAAGADARSAIYPGGHTFTPLEQHLKQMLTFAGRALRS